MISVHRALAAIAIAALCSTASSAPAQECDKTFDSTYDLIQAAIFENKGCTSEQCHGAAAAGGLNLTADVSYDNLVDHAATTPSDIPNLARVVPGQKDESLLFLNLAAATLPEEWDAPLRGMPLGLAPLSLDELEAVREWIEQGAPRTGTVPGTGELLDACLPPAEPIEIAPLPKPEPGKGVQLQMPRWTLAPHTEDEVCFSSYYDVTNQVPESARSGNSFFYNLNQIRQDPLSHHLIVNIYTGDVPPDDPRWGPYRCRGGEKDGESCQATDLGFCGEGSLCASDPVSGPVCAGFGPRDQGTNRFPFSGIQEASAQQSFPPGAFRPVPLKGLIIWNSHAFNLSDKAGKIEAWLNYTFAEPEDQKFVLAPIFNTSRIFNVSVPPFEASEVCHHNVFPPNTRLYEINSHTHQRGKRFRVFEGRYECQGGDRAGEACSPMPDEGMEIDLCGDFECKAVQGATRGDCDDDGVLRINDLITCAGIALGDADISACPDADPNRDGSVSIAELVTFVKDTLAGPTFRVPEENILYTNFVYNDPTIVLYDPAKPMEGSQPDRTLTYCSLYDNGYSDPAEVVRASMRPTNAGPCDPTHCTEGRAGDECSGDPDDPAARDASCDSTPGAGDGVCDACTLRGGFTTEDEMFILMGAFFVEPS